MTPASELTHRVASITGVPFATVYGVKRRFVETGIWPSSRGAHVPDLDSYHLVMLLLALMADVPAKDAASTANAYYSLADTLGNKLGDSLVNILNSFRSNNPVSQVAAKSRVEVYTTTRELASTPIAKMASLKHRTACNPISGRSLAFGAPQSFPENVFST